MTDRSSTKPPSSKGKASGRTGGTAKRPRKEAAAQSAAKADNPADADVAAPSPARPAEVETSRWTFLTNHSHVLLLLAQDASMVLREVAAHVGITERAVQRIIADLEDGGVLEREKIGRKNHYRIHTDVPLRHPVEAHRTVADLIALVADR